MTATHVHALEPKKKKEKGVCVGVQKYRFAWEVPSWEVQKYRFAWEVPS